MLVGGTLAQKACSGPRGGLVVAARAASGLGVATRAGVARWAGPTGASAARKHVVAASYRVKIIDGLIVCFGIVTIEAATAYSVLASGTRTASSGSFIAMSDIKTTLHVAYTGC